MDLLPKLKLVAHAAMEQVSVVMLAQLAVDLMAAAVLIVVPMAAAVAKVDAAVETTVQTVTS